MHFAKMRQGELRVHLVSAPCHSNVTIRMTIRVHKRDGMDGMDGMDAKIVIKVAPDTRQDLQ
jgi:hypothetical protein